MISLHFSFHMGKFFTCCLPIPLLKALFILCHLILTTNPWGHGIASTFQIRGARGPRSSSNFPLWPARPVPLGFWQQDQKEREKERRSGWRGRGLGDSVECWKRWGHCNRSGRKQERRDRFRSSAVICVSPLDCWRNVRIELGLFWNYIYLDRLCFFVWDTALRLDHIGDGFIITKVVLNGQLQCFKENSKYSWSMGMRRL